MNFNLLFEEQTESQWLELWLKESGGRSVEEFIKKIDHHFAIKPYYTRDSARNAAKDVCRTLIEPVVAEWVHVGDLTPDNINSEILKSLNSGATGLYINVQQLHSWEALLREVGMEYITSIVDFRQDFSAGYRSLEAFLSLTRLENSAHKVKVVLPWTNDVRAFKEIVHDLHEELCGLLIDLAEPLESGVPPGLVLAFGIELLNEIYSTKPSLLNKIGYLTCCNGFVYQDFVLNKAIRILHHAWMAKSGHPVESVYIHTRTGRSDQISIDIHTNLIKNSIKVLSALVSGADGITVLPYDVSQEFDKNSKRLARNQALIAIYEAKLNRFRDPLAGSYTFEALTDGLIDTALEYLKDLESFPSVFDFISSSDFEEKVEAYRKALTEDFKKGDRTLVGVTKFQPKGQRLNPIEIEFRKGSPFTPFAIQNEFL